ncbi:helicase-associated domain-containing protein [Thermoleptolyngbya sp. C42_A2020_037]|uniref:helicase-associated domain-containing protein n=1 Tax=Thermoleptolyngbya sp. C42_A2020_037 TaxID=2747799 RepID=UPI0019EE22A2|nr:helicase-associated domain-containing protein [Thermoleptolyngbya sp. C42_A2020_037]MBF2083495.1 helicase-associated domain-containing protein [Thermoleptolyngbya sp. C42_A2020_037]
MAYYSQPDSIPRLSEALNHLTVDQLKSLAGLVSEDKPPLRKTELVNFILQGMEGGALRRLWERCDLLQRAAIAEVVHAEDDRFNKTRFACKYGKSPKWGTGSTYSYHFKPSVLSLFFYAGTMPKDLKARLKAFVPPPEPTPIPSVETVGDSQPAQQRRYESGQRQPKIHTLHLPQKLQDTEQIARRDLQAVLRLVDLGKVSVSDKTFFPTTATLSAIAEVLEAGDYYSDWPAKESPGGWRYSYDIGFIKPFAWVMLLQAAKFVELNGKRLSLTKTGQKALGDPPEKTLQTLWKAWLKNTLLDELRRVESIKGQTGKAKRSLTAVAGRRSKIVEALKDCPVGRWVSLMHFLRYIIAAGYEFEVSRNPESLTLEDHGPIYSASFVILEARYVAAFLFEYAATLGLIDVAYVHPDDALFQWSLEGGLLNLDKVAENTDDDDGETALSKVIQILSNDSPFEDFHTRNCLSRYDGLSYFRLTPLGAYVLGLSDRYVPAALPQKQVLRVLPNREVVALQPLSRADRLMLDSLLQPVSDSVWQLEQAKLLDAIAQGRTVEELQAFLEANSVEALPQTVLQFLSDLQGRTTRLQPLSTARVIRCADAALAMQIANDSRTKAYCFLADQPQAIAAGQATYLIVPLESETKFNNALKKLGYSLPGLG